MIVGYGTCGCPYHPLKPKESNASSQIIKVDWQHWDPVKHGSAETGSKADMRKVENHPKLTFLGNLKIPQIESLATVTTS